MAIPVLPSPPLPFRHRFDSSSPPALTPSPLSQTAWPEEEEELETPVASTSGRRASLPPFSKVKTDRELYIAALEHRLHSARSKSDPSLVKHYPVPTVSPSRLSPLILTDDSSSEDEEDDGSSESEEDDEGTSDTEADDESESATRPLLPSRHRHHRQKRSSLSSNGSTSRRSRSTSRRRQSLTPSTAPNSAGGRIAFAPIVRIGAGIRSLASSYTYPSNFPSRPGTSRSSSPASSIYAPLLPGPGSAPGAAFRQGKQYGAVPPAVLQRQAVENGMEGSPYKRLLEQQRAKRRNRKRRKAWQRFRRAVLDVLCWPFRWCWRCTGDDEEQV